MSRHNSGPERLHIRLPGRNGISVWRSGGGKGLKQQGRGGYRARKQEDCGLTVCLRKTRSFGSGPGSGSGSGLGSCFAWAVVWVEQGLLGSVAAASLAIVAEARVKGSYQEDGAGKERRDVQGGAKTLRGKVRLRRSRSGTKAVALRVASCRSRPRRNSCVLNSSCCRACFDCLLIAHSSGEHRTGLKGLLLFCTFNRRLYRTPRRSLHLLVRLAVASHH